MKKQNWGPRTMSVRNYNREKLTKAQTQIRLQGQTYDSSTSIGVHQQKVYFIFSVVKVTYPQYLHNVDFQKFKSYSIYQFLQKMLKDIKAEHQKKILEQSSINTNLKIQLKILKDSETENERKFKQLQNQLNDLSRKLKLKSEDCYKKMQQLFIEKQRNQNLERQIVHKNLQNTAIFQQWQKFKQDFTSRIQVKQTRIFELQLQNKKLQKQIIRLRQQILNTDYQNTRANSININKKSNNYLQPFSQQSRNRIRSRSNSSGFKGKLVNQQAISMDSQQLIAQIRQLRDNQSALLDRLAERDKIIQNLEVSLNQSKVD